MPVPRTELEHCVLAVIARIQPVTRYGVMKVFAASQSSRWSSTAGSIYPLLARLERAGMVQSQPGERRTRTFSLTAAGERAVATWVAGEDDALGKVTDDPIRTRAGFLDLLAPADQARVAEAWRRVTREEIAVAKANRARLEALGDHASERSHDGALRQLEARLAWLEDRFE